MHGDIKPDNVIFDKITCDIRLGDFGRLRAVPTCRAEGVNYGPLSKYPADTSYHAPFGKVNLIQPLHHGTFGWRSIESLLGRMRNPN